MDLESKSVRRDVLQKDGGRRASANVTNDVRRELGDGE
jgi:hypothetical protein